MSSVKDKVCVVTGAGSGIGRALSLELASRGARAIAISDVSDAGLVTTAALLESHHPIPEIHTSTLDVVSRAAFADYATAVAGRFGVVHQLYNNAGIAGAARLLERDYAAFERVLSVNLWGVIHGTTEFLPYLIASGEGHVVNISSLNGYVAQAGLTPYCTSKFAVRGFTECLRAEMMRDRRPVRVTVVHPGGVRTDIASASLRDAHRPVTAEDERRARLYNEKLLRMDPARAATRIIDGVERGRPRVRVGNDARAMDILVRLLPGRYLHVTGLLERLVAR